MARRHNNLNSLFQDISNSLKAKGAIDETQDAGEYLADNFDQAILTIDTDPSGDATATAADILSPKTAYVQGQKITGTIPTRSGGTITLDTTTTSYECPAGYYPLHTAQIVTETKEVEPSESVKYVTPTSGKVLSKVTVDAIDPYYIGSAVTTKGAATYNVSESDRTIDAGQYLSGDQIIKGVKITNVSAANIKTGVTVKVGDSADDDRLKNVAGTFSASSTITGTGKSAAAAGDILTGKSAFLNGAQLDGTMANNGDVSGTITTQGGTKTIPAGYTSGGTVTADIPATTLTNSIISGAAIEETTGDYGWKSTVQIPAGYHNSQTLTKIFSDVFPAPQTEGSASQMLAGYQLYDHSGKLITGTMTNNGAVSASLNTGTTSYTVPAGYHNGSGKVSITTQTKSATPTESAQTISPDSGKVLSSVSVGAIPSNYVGSDIPKDPTMTVSGGTVTAPVGYYSVAQSKSVANMTLPTSTSSSATSGSTTKATVGRSTSDQYINIPVGYNSATANYKISAVANGSATTPATSVSPGAGTGSVASSTGLVTITSAEATKSVTPTVSAGYVSSGTAGTITVPATTFTYQLPTTKAATTFTPTTSNQTIAAGTYLTGVQTIKGDSNLVAGNIKKDVTIFGITGTHEGGSGDVTTVEYDTSGKTAMAYLNGKASVASSSGIYTLTSNVGSVTSSSGVYTLTLADAC